MAPLTFHLLKISNSTAFLSSLRSLSPADRPLYVGETKHWIHEPTLSTAALTGSDPEPTAWDYLVVAPSAGEDGLALPAGVNDTVVEKKWSVTAPVDDEMFINPFKDQHVRRLSSTGPVLPTGWSPDDHTGLDASDPPADLSASLGLRSRPLGKRDAVTLKDYIPTLAPTHNNVPVSMFNLLAYTPNGGREQYMGYIQAFSASTGSKYGGEPLFLGRYISDWTSKDSEQGQPGWDSCALVWYPSLWHFGKMLDDPGYAAADREFKQGAIVDNPLICCTEVEVGYVD